MRSCCLSGRYYSFYMISSHCLHPAVRIQVFARFRDLNSTKQRGDRAKGVIAIRSRERSERVLSNGAPLITRTYRISSLETLKVPIFSAKKIFFDHLPSSENPRFKLELSQKVQENGVDGPRRSYRAVILSNKVAILVCRLCHCR